MELGESGTLISDYTIKLKSSKSVSYWHKNRNIDQWNRTENPEISPCPYSQLKYEKGGKATQCWKVSSTNGAMKTGQPRVKK